MAEPQAGSLKGLRLLIVEDEYAIASDLTDTLGCVDGFDQDEAQGERDES
jgi:hypothetical protein